MSSSLPGIRSKLICSDELDSHLYQSVGTQVLPFIARALSLPLFTRTVRGKAVSRETEYGSRLPSGDRTGQEGDETEDLTLLLRDVMVRLFAWLAMTGIILIVSASTSRGDCFSVWSDPFQLPTTSNRACLWTTETGLASLPVATASTPSTG